MKIHQKILIPMSCLSKSLEPTGSQIFPLHVYLAPCWGSSLRKVLPHYRTLCSDAFKECWEIYCQVWWGENFENQL